MALLIAMMTVGAVGLWINSGRAQAWFQNTEFYDTPLERLSRPIFLLLMSQVAGIVFLVLVGVTYQKYPENELWALLVAWTIGWWVGNFFYAPLSAEQRDWLRRKLGGGRRR